MKAESPTRIKREDLNVLAEFNYERTEVERGYTNRTLYVNLSDNAIESRPVTQEMKDIFVGGKGFGLWRLWHGVTGGTKWNDADNEIVISSGPLGGTTTYPGSGKSLVVSISPTTHSIIDSNVGGYFGPLLKFAGWDAIELQGKAEEDIIRSYDLHANCYVTKPVDLDQFMNVVKAIEDFWLTLVKLPGA